MGNRCLQDATLQHHSERCCRFTRGIFTECLCHGSERYVQSRSEVEEEQAFRGGRSSRRWTCGTLTATQFA